ncbi:hypothetical protein [Nocardioides sp.]|uniref:hypothetical protein n=1 Tax=Nocardioides sp. TaxID=35761 RepID=UPI0039E65930
MEVETAVDQIGLIIATRMRQERYLGHAGPGFTLRTYTHLMEGSSERTERAIDAVSSRWVM